MAHDQAAVREVLDKARVEGRTALTAPEGRKICQAYGISTPGEGGDLGRGGGVARRGDRPAGGAQDRLS